jgi:hypothetical protein
MLASQHHNGAIIENKALYWCECEAFFIVLKEFCVGP